MHLPSLPRTILSMYVCVVMWQLQRPNIWNDFQPCLCSRMPSQLLLPALHAPFVFQPLSVACLLNSVNSPLPAELVILNIRSQSGSSWAAAAGVTAHHRSAIPSKTTWPRRGPRATVECPDALHMPYCLHRSHAVCTHPPCIYAEPTVRQEGTGHEDTTRAAAQLAASSGWS